MPVGTREDVWAGRADRTSGGLRKADLMMGSGGKLMSIKASTAAKARMKGRGASAVGSTGLADSPVSIPAPVLRADTLPVPRDAAADRIAVANRDYQRAALRVSEQPEALTKKAVNGSIRVVSGLSNSSAVAHGDSDVVDANLVASQLVASAAQRGAAAAPLSIADIQRFVQRVVRAPVDEGEIQRLLISEGMRPTQLALPAPAARPALGPVIDLAQLANQGFPEETALMLKERLGPRRALEWTGEVQEALLEDEDIARMVAEDEALSDDDFEGNLLGELRGPAPGDPDLLRRLSALREDDPLDDGPEVDVPDWDASSLSSLDTFLSALTRAEPVPEIPEEVAQRVPGILEAAARAPPATPDDSDDEIARMIPDLLGLARTLKSPNVIGLARELEDSDDDSQLADDEGSTVSGSGFWKDAGRFFNKARKAVGGVLRKKETAALLNSLAAISGQPQLAIAAKIAPDVGALIGSGAPCMKPGRRCSRASALRALQGAALVRNLAGPKVSGGSIATALKVAAPFLGKALKSKEAPMLFGMLGKALGGKKGQRIATDVTRKIAPILGSLLGGGARLPGQGARLPGQGARLPGQGARLPGQGARLPGQGAVLPGGGPGPKFWRSAAKALAKGSRALGRTLKKPEAKSLLKDVAKIAGVDSKYIGIAADLLPQIGGLLGGGPMSAKQFFDSVGKAFRGAAPVIGKVLRRKEVGDIARSLGTAFGRPELGKAAADIAGSVGSLLGGAAMTGRGTDEAIVANFVQGFGRIATSGAGSRGGVCGAGFVRDVGAAIEDAVARIQPADIADVRRVSNAMADIISGLKNASPRRVAGRGESWMAGAHQKALADKMEYMAEHSDSGPAFSAYTPGAQKGGRGTVADPDFSARTPGQEKGGRGIMIPGSGKKRL